ncbi:MAG: hypothetical protein HYZ14_01285 [Bacteroidetes bacterium]|nr:hypothetical protein [Bacteroidota bacterium]
MTRLSNVIPFPGAERTKTYLLLVSPESIPHLCLIHGGLYYSLTYKECENARDFVPYLASLVRAKRKLLFVEIDRVAENPWTIFKKYEKLAGLDLTCLQPIKETIFENSNAGFVFELIQELQNADRIKQVYHMNMEPDFKNQDFFSLREYSKEAIFTYIQALNEKHAKKQ